MISKIAPSLFAPYAEAIRLGHAIAHDLPVKPALKKQPEPITIRFSDDPYLTAYYNRPNGYSGD